MLLRSLFSALDFVLLLAQHYWHYYSKSSSTIYGICSASSLFRFSIISGVTEGEMGALALAPLLGGAISCQVKNRGAVFIIHMSWFLAPGRDESFFYALEKNNNFLQFSESYRLSIYEGNYEENYLLIRHYFPNLDCEI